MDAPVKALNSEKAKALQAALAQIEKQFGKGSIMRLGEGEKIEDIEVVSTGSLGLDIALGVGGLPRGRVVEIYGPESSGKTTLTLQVIAEMQKGGGTCAFIDAEHALDTAYAQKLGVNLQELLISQPDTGEQALEIVDAHRAVKFQCVAAGGRFGIAEHHADLHTDLVDEDDCGVRFVGDRGEFAERLRHQASLQTHM